MSELHTQDRRFLRSVGLLLVVSLVAILFLVRSCQQSSGVLSRKFLLHATTAHVGGLEQDAPVALAGYKVGKVLAIELQPDKTLRLTLEIENRARAFIRADSRASLKKPLIGATSVDVSMGSADQRELADGDSLPLSVRPDFNDVVASLPERLEKLDRALAHVTEMSQTLNVAAQRLAGSDGAINTALTEVTLAARGGRGAADALQTTLVDMRGLVKAAAPVLQQSHDALAEVRVATAKFSALEESAARSLDQLEVFTTALRQAAPQVGTTLASGQSAAEQTEKTVRAVRSSILFRKDTQDAGATPLLMTPRAP